MIVSKPCPADDPNDAFWLAQTYFHMHQYARAERILTRPFRTKPNRSGPAAAQDNTTDLAQSRRRQSTVQHANGTTLNNTAAGAYFGNGPDVAIAPTRLPVGPAAMIDVAAEELEGVSRLVDMSIACRYLCAQALVPLLPYSSIDMELICVCSHARADGEMLLKCLGNQTLSNHQVRWLRSGMQGSLRLSFQRSSERTWGTEC